MFDRHFACWICNKLQCMYVCVYIYIYWDKLLWTIRIVFTLAVYSKHIKQVPFWHIRNHQSDFYPKDLSLYLSLKDFYPFSCWWHAMHILCLLPMQTNAGQSRDYDPGWRVLCHFWLVVSTYAKQQDIGILIPAGWIDILYQPEIGSIGDDSNPTNCQDDLVVRSL